MDVENIIIGEDFISVINTDGGTHTVAMDSDDETLNDLVDIIISSVQVIVETVPEDLFFDDEEFGDDEDDFDE
jgi:hypothetical protein